MDEEDDEQMWWLEEGNNTLMPPEYTYDEYPDIDPNDLVYPDIAPPRGFRSHLYRRMASVYHPHRMHLQ